MMRARPTVVTLIVLSAITLQGCTWTFRYTSGVKVDHRLNIPHKIVVEIKGERLSRHFNSAQRMEEIKAAIIEDIERNIFSSRQAPIAHIIIVNVTVEELEYKASVYGLLYLPLAFVGVPTTKFTGIARVRVALYYKDGTKIDEYVSNVSLTKWAGVYFGRKYDLPSDGGIPKVALRQAMEDIKLQIEGNRDQLLAEIQRLDASQETPAAVRDSQVTPAKREEDVPSLAPPLVADVDRGIPHGRVEYRDAVAVVIGNKDYTCADVPAVDYAINDAVILKQYVTDLLGYREGNIVYVENATGAEFRSIFGTQEYPGRLANMVKEGKSDVFVYYSGHGAPDPNTKQGYFIPVDCCPDDARLNGYPLETFYENVGKLSPRSLTIVIDACFSGGSNAGMLIRQASPLSIEVENPAAFGPKRAVFTSSSGNQISSWYPEMKHGLFTYFFLKGLKGKADLNGDLKLTSRELFDYISDKTNGVPYMARSLYSGRIQTPSLSGDTTFVLVEY